MPGNEVISVLGASIEIVISSQSSNNTCCVLIETTPPGGSPPPHRHDREEEVFTVLEGEFEFYDGAAWSPIAVASPRFSPRGHYHAFRNVGPRPGRMTAMTNGGGIDAYFRAISGFRMPEDIDELTGISGHYGYYFLPPPKC